MICLIFSLIRFTSFFFNTIKLKNHAQSKTDIAWQIEWSHNTKPCILLNGKIGAKIYFLFNCFIANLGWELSKRRQFLYNILRSLLQSHRNDVPIFFLSHVTCVCICPKKKNACICLFVSYKKKTQCLFCVHSP